METKEKKAWIVSAMMGLGHMRAAYPLHELAKDGIIVEGSRDFCDPAEYKVWRKMRHFYYFISQAEELPFIGKYFLKLLNRIQKIPPFYPVRDLSKPTSLTSFLIRLILKSGLSHTLIKKIAQDNLAMVSTFYASSIAVDMVEKKERDNYLLICDSDFNRVWVSEDPGKSRIKYLAPCTRVRKRLLSYGVPEERIFLTGFPLPKENIGTKENLEVLKNDLFARLVRLDPKLRFFSVHKNTVKRYLDLDCPTEKVDKHFTLTFAVGGSGAHTCMVYNSLKSLRHKIKQGRIKINISAGMSQVVAGKVLHYVDNHGLSDHLGDGINIIYDSDMFRYFDMFNRTLRTTDVLWSKPSELTFYCALGIPILLAPSVGTHEELNRKWLEDIHAGVNPAGPIEYADEWLFDLREAGNFAEAA